MLCGDGCRVVGLWRPASCKVRQGDGLVEQVVDMKWIVGCERKGGRERVCVAAPVSVVKKEEGQWRRRVGMKLVSEGPF